MGDVIKELGYYVEHAYKGEENGLVPVCVLKNALDLIRHLQDESVTLKDSAAAECKEHRRFVELAKIIDEKQKAEIERLTEERDGYLNDRFAVCHALRQMKEQNAELQKQVDELKEQRDVFKRLFESANTSNFTTNSIIETMNSFYREQAEHLAGLKIEQAVKDEAKEILDGLSERKERVKNFYGVAESVGVDIAINTIKEILKQKGVEVE